MTIAEQIIEDCLLEAGVSLSPILLHYTIKSIEKIIDSHGDDVLNASNAIATMVVEKCSWKLQHFSPTVQATYENTFREIVYDHLKKDD